MEIPSTAPDAAFAREVFVRALTRKCFPDGTPMSSRVGITAGRYLDAVQRGDVVPGAWLYLESTHAAAIQIKDAIRTYMSAALVAAVTDGYVPHPTGYLDPLLADPLDDATVARALQARVAAGYPLRKITRGPAMEALQAAIQTIKALVQMDEQTPFFNHVEYILDFAHIDRTDWDTSEGLACPALRKAMMQIPFGSELFRPIPPDVPRVANGQPSGFTQLRTDEARGPMGLLVDDAKTLQWEKAWRKSSFSSKLLEMIHIDLVPTLFAPLGKAGVATFRAELAVIQTTRWKLSLHDERLLAGMTWPSKDDVPAWKQVEIESMRVALVTEAIGARAQGAPRPESMLPSETNVLTAHNTAAIFSWAKKNMKTRQATLDGEEVPVVFTRPYLQVTGSWARMLTFADEIDRQGSLHMVLGDAYGRDNTERVNAANVIKAWGFLVPPLRTDGSLLDRHGAAMRLAHSHPEVPAVTASDLADAYQNTMLKEYGGWTEGSGIPFGQLLSPAAQALQLDSSMEEGQPSLDVNTLPDKNTPVGQAQLRVAADLGADVSRVDPTVAAVSRDGEEYDPTHEEDEAKHRANRLQIAMGMGISVGTLFEMGLLDVEVPDSDVVPESVSSPNPDSQGGSQPPRSEDADMQSVHSSDMPDGDTHIHTDEEMPGLQESSSSNPSTPASSQPSTPRNTEDKTFSEAFARIATQQAQPQEPEPLAPPFRNEVDATAMMDDMLDNAQPMFGEDYRRALGELQIALGFTEEMMILHLTEWQMLKELLEGSTVTPAAQVLLLAGWRHRRDFVLAIQKALDARHLQTSITWIEPLPPLTDIERTVQPSTVDKAWRREHLARKPDPEPRPIFQTRRTPDATPYAVRADAAVRARTPTTVKHPGNPDFRKFHASDGSTPASADTVH